MAFTDLDNQSYNKIILARITHGEHDTSFTSLGGGDYEWTFKRPVAKILRNGVALTEVSSAPTVDDTYFVDEDAETITIQLASAPNSTTNVIVIYTYLFYTNERSRTIPQNPDSAESSSNPLRDWEPKLTGEPKFRQSVKNILDGILTSSGSNINIINTDNALNPLVSTNNSFSNKDVEIWFALDSVSSIDKIYIGAINGITIKDTIATFKVTDITSKLDVPAYMGDTLEENVHRLVDNSTLDPNSDGLPKRFYLGKASRLVLGDDNSTSYGGTTKKPVSLDTAINTNKSDNITTTTNRNWSVGRAIDGAVDVTATLSTIVSGGFGNDFIEITHTTASGPGFKVGQGIKYTSTGREERIVAILSSTSIVTTWDTGTANPSTSTTITGQAITAYIFDVNANGQSTFVPASGISSFSNTNTSGGNIEVDFTFANNFEGSIADFGGNPFNPEIHTVKFIAVFGVSTLAQEDVVEEILVKAGMTGGTGLPTFTDESTAVFDVRFSIPYFDQLDYSNYRRYLEDLLTTSNGMVFVDTDEIKYRTITTPSTQSETLTTEQTLKNSRTMDIDYRDISHFITGFNPHSEVSESGVESLKHRYLHDVNRTTRFRHLAEEIDSNILTNKAKIARNRRAIFKYSTFTQDLDKVPGDDVTLDNDITDTNPTTKNITVLSVEKSTRTVNISGSDILDD